MSKKISAKTLALVSTVAILGSANAVVPAFAQTEETTTTAPTRQPCDCDLPTVEVSDDGNGNLIVQVKDADGNVTSEETVAKPKDGQDGGTPTVEIVDNNDGTKTVTVTNADGSTSSATVKDGKDGDDGKDGKDGVSPAAPKVSVSKDADGVVTVTVTDADGKESSESFAPGEDGQSPSIEATPNEDGTVTVVTKDAAGNETSRAVVAAGKDGADGKDGKDGKNAGRVEIVRNADGSVELVVRDGEDKEVDRVVFPKGWELERGKIFDVKTKRGADGKLVLEIVHVDGSVTTEVLEGKPGPKGDKGEPGAAAKSSDSEVLDRCVANALGSPAVWLLPVGLLVAVGAPVLDQVGGPVKEQVDRINAEIASRVSFGREGSGGSSNGVGGEFGAQIDALNRQIGQAFASPQAQQAGQILGAVAVLAATGGLLYHWCTTEPGEASSSNNTAGSSKPAVTTEQKVPENSTEAGKAA